MSSPDETSAGPVIRDLRRIDPATGQVRGRPAGKHSASRPGGSGEPGAQATAGQASGDAAPPGGQPEQAQAGEAGGATQDAELAARLAERTADLQRVTAEYANYRKRVERDRLAVREQALANVLMALIPVLDDIGRAREHGELVGGFKSVAESLEAIATKLGLVAYGDEGEPFDPNVHEALTHSYSADVTEPTCVAILQPGYKVGDRILRPARVAVAEPRQADDGGETADGGGSADGGEPAGDGAAGAAGAGQASDGGGPGEAPGDREEHD